jgi:NAD(P)H-nitrite reductase large subunit
MNNAEKRRYVILGAGPAGVKAAENLRQCDRTGDIVIVNGEDEAPYARMAIPYLLAGKIGAEGARLRSAPEHFDALGIRIARGRAAALDAAAHTVRLEDGAVLPYDRLLIATGSRPARENVPGIDLAAVHTCWTLADARVIVERVRPGTQVVQMGAGFVGCIIMEGLVSRGAQLTVMVRSGLMVSRMIHPVAGEMIRRWCETKDVRILPKTQTTKIEAAPGGGLNVTTSTGAVLPADLYLSAVGVKTNTEWLAGSGVAVENGILVDQSMRTNVADVFAAGDVAESIDCVTGHRQLNAIQPNAVEQGRIAALNMAGRATATSGSLAFNVLDTLGLVSSSFGEWKGVPGGEYGELRDDARWRYLRLEFCGDRLIGANSVGFTQHIGALRGLIERRVKLGRWKQELIANPTRIMEAYLATAQAVVR